MHTSLCRAFAAAGLCLLGACSEGSRDEGLVAAVSVSHYTADTEPATEASVTPKHGGGDVKTFRRSDGMRIDLEAGRVYLLPMRIESCGVSAAALLRSIAGTLLPAAQAHGDSGSADLGAVVDVMEEDGTEVDIGDLGLAPGDYCGVTVQLAVAPVSDESGTDEESLAAGQSAHVAPCYYPYTVGGGDDHTHDCIEVTLSGITRNVTLAFESPVQLDENHRELLLSLGLRYDRWFDDLAMERLESDADEQSLLADRLLASLVLRSATVQ